MSKKNFYLFLLTPLLDFFGVSREKKTVSSMNTELIRASLITLKAPTNSRLLQNTVGDATSIADWKVRIIDNTQD